MVSAAAARARYLRAVAALDDANTMAQLLRRSQAIAATPDPAGALFVAPALGVKRVGTLSGSFNPLTRAHVALGDAARRVGRLDALIWLIPVVAINKASVERASLVDRLAQMQAFAQASGDGLVLVNRGLYVEQADIVRNLLSEIDELVIIVGFDKIVQILDPIYYQDRRAALDALFSRVEALVAPRGGEDAANLAELLARPENRPYRERISFCPLDTKYQRDSSTTARTLARTGETGRRLHDLLAPEGRALEAEPDVYGVSEDDRYTQRQALIASLGGSPAEQLHPGTRLSELAPLKRSS